MRNQLLRRIAIGLLCAFPLMLASAAFAQGDDPPTPIPSEGPQCTACHHEIEGVWQVGDHSQATFDPLFLEAWELADRDPECLACHTTGYDPETGQFQAEGIVCQACHGEFVEGHPNTPMRVDRSPELCGSCHTETHFEWQASTHREVELGCSSCHDPHETKILAEDTSQLCGRCHQTRLESFNHSVHSLEGLSCGDCHLEATLGEMGSGHATRDHSFNVHLTSCNECHAYQMHESVDGTAAAPTPIPETQMTSTLGPSIGDEPARISPIGFSLVAGFGGLMAGMILSPWLERWFERMRKEEQS